MERSYFHFIEKNINFIYSVRVTIIMDFNRTEQTYCFSIFLTPFQANAIQIFNR